MTITCHLSSDNVSALVKCFFHVQKTRRWLSYIYIDARQYIDLVISYLYGHCLSYKPYGNLRLQKIAVLEKSSLLHLFLQCRSATGIFLNTSCILCPNATDLEMNIFLNFWNAVRFRKKELNNYVNFSTSLNRKCELKNVEMLNN